MSRFALKVFISKVFVSLIVTITISFMAAPSALAMNDPTEGKPFFPWLWDEQIKPTAREAFDIDGFAILFGTTALTIPARQYDSEIRKHYGDNQKMPTGTSAIGSVLGNGGPGVATAIALLIWDQPEGLKLSRAIAFTAASHITIAVIADRNRPNNGPRSFPSGHTSSSFAVAGSLAYSYGPWVGIPALAAATFIGASRIADNAHWFSDTIAAAGLGLFWARASAEADLEKGSLTPKQAPTWSPGVVPGGLTLNFNREF